VIFGASSDACLTLIVVISSNIKSAGTTLALVGATGMLAYSIVWWKESQPNRKTIDYEDSYINAKYFRDELARVKIIDSMYTKDPQTREFLSSRVKVIRNNKHDVQAISMPLDSSRGNYYLIVNDSIYKLRIIKKIGN
jgi:hypothetical protein